MVRPPNRGWDLGLADVGSRCRCTTYNWQISADYEPEEIASYLLSVVVQLLRLEESDAAGY